MRELTPSIFAVLALLGATSTCAAAETVVAKAGLAPQFRTWPIPIYRSRVATMETWAPNSYEIDTADAPAAVFTFFRGRLKGRVANVGSASAKRQVLVDGGNYVINVLPNGRSGTSINVIKN